MWPATHHMHTLFGTKQKCTLTWDQFGRDWPTTFSGLANNNRSCSIRPSCSPAGVSNVLFTVLLSVIHPNVIFSQAHHFEKQSLCNRCVCFQHSWISESIFSELKYCSDMRDVPLHCCCWSCATNKCNSWLWWTVVCKYFGSLFFFSHHKESIHFTYWTFLHWSYSLKWN